MIIIQAVLMTFLPFWRINLPQEALNFGSEIEIVKFDKGRKVSSELVGLDNPKYKVVLDFLKNSKKTWKMDIASYAPQVLIRANGITVNCFEKSTVINFFDKNKDPLQLSMSDMEKPFCGLIIN